VLAAQPLAKGGVFIGLVKMAVGNKIGAEISNITKDDILGLKYGGMILEIPAEEDISELFGTVNAVEIGKTTE
jgi:phosphoribosylformylglycinamidine synthase